MTEEKTEALKEASEVLDYHINTVLNSFDDAEDWEVEKAINLLRETIKELQIENKKIIDKYEKKLEDVRFERDKAIERVVYRCDPNKNKVCNKKSCYINNGPCDATFHPENASFVCLEDFIPKAVLRDTLDKHSVITDNTRYYNADSKQIINVIEKLMEE